MGEKRRFGLLILILIVVAVVVGGTGIGVTYKATLDRERERLANIARSQARLIEAVDRLQPGGISGNQGQDPLTDILETQRSLREVGLGTTAELQLAHREGNLIVYLTPSRDGSHPPASVPFGGPLGEPMSAAISGRSGTMIGRDYIGRLVLAAFEPVGGPGRGLVAKIDMAEINSRYERPATIVSLVSLVVVLSSLGVFFLVGEPMVRQLRQRESSYRQLFENMSLGAAVFRPLPDGGDFVFTELNRAGEKFAKIDRQDVIGQRIGDSVSGIWDLASAEVMARVSRTGEAEYLPARHYQDEHSEGWHDSYVYRLPSGDIVTLVADLSEYKKAEDALRRSEARYRTLVEAQPDPICRFLPDSTLIFVNRAYADFYGREPEELVGRRWLDFSSREERPRFLDELTSFTPENPERHEETLTTRADGVVRWYLCHLYAFFDEGRKIFSFQTFATDITERKRAEEALAASEARARSQLVELETLYRTSPIGLGLFDREFRFVRANEMLAEMNGLPIDQHLGRKVWDVVPYLREAIEPDFRRVLETGEAATLEFSGETAKAPGVERDWVVHCHPVGEADGSIVAIGVIVQDVTEGKQAERALRESEARYRTAGEAIPYGVWICNARGEVEYVSQSFLDLIGKTLAEVRPYGWTERLRPGERERALAAWHECLERGCEWNWEHSIKGVDGAYHTVLSLGRPVRDEDGRIVSWVGFNLDISARKVAEEALRESEARLRRTVENAPFPIMVHAEDGEVVHLSQAWLALTGYTGDEIGSIEAWTERAFASQAEEVRAAISRLYTLDQAVDEGESRIRTADGETRVWTFSSAPLGRDGRGRRLVVSMAADLTEHKSAERALRESELRIRTLLDASQDEIMLLSTAGEILAINKAGERRLARRAGGITPVGSHLDRLFPPEQLQRRKALVNQVASTATPVRKELQVRSRWFDCWYYPVTLPDKAVSEVAVYAREVTDQKEAQAQLNKLLQAIQQSPASVVITDRNGNIEYVNPKFTTLTGYTLEEAIGNNPRILKSGHVTPDQYKELWKTIASGGTWRGELLNKKKSGELFWELASIAPVWDEHAQIVNYVAVKEDITQRKAIEEQFRQSQKMEVLGQLTGGIAHDFNNLLAIILGNLQLLSERVGDDDRIEGFLADSIWSARRGAELTRRLLAFARKQTLKPAVIDLNDVVRGMSELLRRTLGAGIRIEELLANELWQAFADRGELERALVNLAVNARDAMQNVGTLTLETRNARLDEDYAEQYEEVTPGDYVLLAVTDTGTGMLPETMERVFEPFFTTKETGQGSGLGLSMVYGFIKQSGGHISIYSRVGHGTSVKLYLPRAASAAREEGGDPVTDFVTGDLGDKVVLVVEDEPKLRKVAVKMLQRLGLQSLQAGNASDALELLAARHADVLFTDIELPGGMNGTELAEVAHRLDPSMKVLFTTGYAREATIHRRWLKDRVPWLLKPYSHMELARELRALLCAGALG